MNSIGGFVSDLLPLRNVIIDASWKSLVQRFHGGITIGVSIDGLIY